MKFYQVAGILAILSLTFSDCYGYPNIGAKALIGQGKEELEVNDMIEAAMAAQDVAEKQTRTTKGKKHRFGIVTIRDEHSLATSSTGFAFHYCDISLPVKKDLHS